MIILPSLPKASRVYPFGDLEVKECFLMDTQIKIEKDKISQAACQYGKRNKKKFICRSWMDETGEVGEKGKIYYACQRIK